MKYQARKFVQESYDKNDNWAKERVAKLLESKGYEVEIDEVEDYGIDLTAKKNGKTIYVEAEVKHRYKWTNKEDFKFDTVSFLGRKIKWADKGFWYCIVCAETEAIVCCHSDRIYRDANSEIININVTGRRGLDELFRVPKDQCYWF